MSGLTPQEVKVFLDEAASDWDAMRFASYNDVRESGVSARRVAP